MKEDMESLPSEEVKKAKKYLLDSRKNIERLRKGKKPRINIRFLIQDNRKLVYFISTLLIITPFIPLMLPNTLPTYDPNLETVESTVNLLESNFTDQDGYPTHQQATSNTSSELVILSTLTNSMLLQTGYLAYETKNMDKVSLVLQIIENGTFRVFSNSSEQLSVRNQLLGFYSLMQAYYSLEHSSSVFSKSSVTNVLAQIIHNYYSTERNLIVNQDSNSTHLIDQALCISAITTFYLLFKINYIGVNDNGTVYGYYLDYIVENLFISMYQNFYNSTSDSYFNSFDVYTNSSSGSADIESLMFLTLGLTKASYADRYYIYFPTTGYWLHQSIVNEYVDSNWLVHANHVDDSFLNIRNQAYLSLITYLMNLRYLGVELVNATSNNYITERGFLENLNEQEVTVESCLFGLMALASEKWSLLELEREKIEPTTTIQASAIGALWSIMTLIIVLVSARRLKKKLRKNNW